MPVAAPILSLSGVTLRYEHGVCALDRLTLAIETGERVCILGANGSGKSSLASVLAGLLAPDEGDVTLVGKKVCRGGMRDFGAYRQARRELGLVFQNPDEQIVTSVVEEDVAFGPENLGMPAEQIGPRVERELKRVALQAYAKADPSHLSGGQKQRLAIAGAMAMQPRVLILDEPGSLLDVRGRRGIMRVMRELHAAGTTIVHITHVMEEALEAERVLVMDHGRIAIEGKPEEVFSHAEKLADLGLELPFSAKLAEELCKRGYTISWTGTDAALLEQLAGIPGAGSSQQRRQQHGLAPKAAQATHPAHCPTASDHPAQQLSPHSSKLEQPTSPVIELHNLHYSYGTADAREKMHPAVDGISLTIHAGTSCALIGQTGSGKSTLVRLMCALELPDQGSVHICGINTATRKKRRQLHTRIGYVMQHPERQLFAESVWKDVAFGPTNLQLSAQEIEQRTQAALELVGLAGKEQLSPFHLSGGQQRLCAIAGVLAMQPQVLLLDEPSAGLDPRGRKKVQEVLRAVQEQGVTIVQVTHAMEDAARADQLVVLKEGRVLMEGSPREAFSLRNEKSLREAGLGLPQPALWARTLGLVNEHASQLPLSLDELLSMLERSKEG